ncbi:hypothetical protein OK016_00110 [Vibrio chagasii]|nr:hypothetical protein [Vibrio chagasii]
MQRAATSRSLRKDPTAATTTINDDSDVTTGASVSGCARSLCRENITYTATSDDPADAGARVTVTPSNGATITTADGATSGTTTVPASDDVYVGGDTARDHH